MSQQIIKKASYILLSMCFFVLNTAVNAQEASGSSEATQLTRSLIKQKLEEYQDLYPDILFLHFEGGNELLDEMTALDLVLGYQPRSMDYEHPPHLREDLLIVSVERIIQMLRYQAPSASLFQADTPLGWQQYVCVITLAPDNMATSSLQATGYLLALPDQIINSIPGHMQLLPEDYLEFVVDHEAYHCLKSMYVGPQPLSHKEFWADYQHFLEEQSADSYALAMHIKNRGEMSSFGKNLQRIRCLSLYGADPAHLTSKALGLVLSMPLASITSMTANDVFALANRIKQKLTIDYDDYVQYLSASVQAMQTLGVAASLIEPLPKRLENVTAEPTMVNQLVNETHTCLTELSPGK